MRQDSVQLQWAIRPRRRTTFRPPWVRARRRRILQPPQSVRNLLQVNSTQPRSVRLVLRSEEAPPRRDRTAPNSFRRSHPRRGGSGLRSGGADPRGRVLLGAGALRGSHSPRVPQRRPCAPWTSIGQAVSASRAGRALPISASGSCPPAACRNSRGPARPRRHRTLFPPGRAAVDWRRRKVSGRRRRRAGRGRSS